MSSDAKTTFDPTENESVGDKLGYEKDSKERLPWEHYLSQYRDADPKEIATRLGISYNEAEKYFALKFLGTVYQISWPDFEVSHEEDDMGFYPLETMVYAKTLWVIKVSLSIIPSLKTTFLLVSAATSGSCVTTIIVFPLLLISCNNFIIS